MTFKEQVNALKQKISAKITADSTPEETEEVTGLVAEIDALDSAYNELETEHAKTKSALVRMVINQGSSDKPSDDTDGSKPKTIDECVAEELAKGGK